MKTFQGQSLPIIPAAAGNPQGERAEEDVTFNGVVVVQKGQWYNPLYLRAIEEGCAAPKTTKKIEPSENK